MTIYSPIHYKYLTERFINHVKEIHGDRYDYSKINYTTAHTPIEIVCPKHGSFFNLPQRIITIKTPCPVCRHPNPPKGPYIKKLPPKPLPDEVVDGKPVWIKYCPKCNRKQIYHTERCKRIAIKDNAICKWCQSYQKTIYFMPPKPWIRQCVDCKCDVIIKTKVGFHSQKSCRCKKCRKIWMSKIISDMQPKINKAGYKYKPYVFPDGRVEMVQGYEPKTLNYLISSSIHPNDIIVKYSEKPKISYEFSGSIHPYVPDAYISSSNTIVETKSSWTWKSSLNKNMAKIKGTNDAGHNMRVIIWKGTKKLISDTLYSSEL